jgi:hypothetical protein
VQSRPNSAQTVAVATPCWPAPVAHAPRQQDLAQAVVDLVRAGVEQVLAFEKDAGAAQVFAETFGFIQRGWAAGVVVQQVVEFGLKSGVLAGGGIGLLQLLQRGHERLRDVAPAVGTEVAASVGGGRFGAHDFYSS